MPDRRDKTIQYFFIIIFVLLAFISFLMLRPFVTGIIGGVVLSYLLYPIYKRVFAMTRMETLSAVIVCLLVVMLLALPFLLMGKQLSREAQNVVKIGSQTVDVAKNPCIDDTQPSCKVYNILLFLMTDQHTSTYVQSSIQGIISFFVSQVRSMLFAFPMILTQIFIAMFICYYLVRNGSEIIHKIEDLLPLKEAHRKRVAQQVDSTIYGVLYGQVVVGIIQGLVATIGYFLFGISAPIIMGIITIVVSFVPIFGTAIVWFPLALVRLIAGLAVHDTTMALQGAGLLLWGFLFVSVIDNLIRPKIISDRANVHPVLVLLGVLGGILLFGMVGILLGPLLLSILVEFTKIYIKERGNFQ